MSADLMVFDKSKAPVEPMEFLKWFYEKTAWTSDRDYYDIKGASPELVIFFMEIIREYPAMNGPFAPSDEEMEKVEENPKYLIGFSCERRMEKTEELGFAMLYTGYWI